jgi:pentose-5-phosphate-3-epimerase
VSFGTLSNAHTKYITFDVMDMSYPYNAMFGRGFVNTFEAALHSLYLYLKIPVAQEVISAHGNQRDARNIEQGYAPGHINVNYM